MGKFIPTRTIADRSRVMIVHNTSRAVGLYSKHALAVSRGGRWG